MHDAHAGSKGGATGPMLFLQLVLWQGHLLFDGHEGLQISYDKSDTPGNRVAVACQDDRAETSIG